MEFQNFPTDYHTWGFPVFVIEYPMQGDPVGLLKWEPRESTGVYLVHSIFHAGSVTIVLNTRTGNIFPQYYAVFCNTFSTVEHIRKGAVPVNCKNLVKEHSAIAIQENFTITKYCHINEY